MPLLTFCDAPSLTKKVETLEEKTELINELQLQMRKQAEQIAKLQEEKEQTYADYANYNYGSGQFIEKQEKKIEDLKAQIQMHMNNQGTDLLVDKVKNTRSFADNVSNETHTQEKMIDALAKKVDELTKRLDEHSRSKPKT